MAEEGEVVLESAAPAEVQARALEMGWIPPERYKGDPERFIDADAFVERGETILPIVKKRAEKLEAELAALRGRVSKQDELLKANAEAMAALEDYHTKETKRKIQAAREGWKAEIKRASEADDHEALAEATDQLTQLNAEVLAAEKAEAEVARLREGIEALADQWEADPSNDRTAGPPQPEDYGMDLRALLAEGGE
jgi:DNA-directed RNA polymerase